MKTLIDEGRIEQGVADLAARIRAAHGDGPLTVLGIMTGSVMLLADLIRRLDLPLRVGVVQASSYRGGTEPGDLTISTDGLPDIAGRDVLLVDDIFDTGRTLEAMTRELARLGPKSIRSAVLLFKEGRARVPMRPDFQVFDIPDRFVVGYGLDYRDLYRHLPYIAVLEDADLKGVE